MIVFRISSEKYAEGLTASGVENRWNEDGQFVIYTSSSRALSTLEMAVHRASIRPNIQYKMMVIEIDDDPDLYNSIDITDLPENWRKLSAYPSLQKVGSAWYKARESLFLQVPSVLIPKESNLVLNTRHPLFEKKVLLLDIEDYFWDSRLLES